jgi:purine-nucleoside phosphorylase
MRRPLFALLVIGSSLMVGCAQSRPLREYSAYNATERIILPQDYVAYLKREKFTQGELDHLPSAAIILHHDDVEGYLRALGYSKWEKLQTGETDPNVMYVVREQGKEFIVDRGLPGAGGITTQAAELAALGVKQIIHIGTAGFIGPDLPDRAIVVSVGSIRDGAAVMLSDDPGEPVSRVDRTLLFQIGMAMGKQDLRMINGLGYTSPIFYLQPSGVIKELIRETRASYVEMEGAPFFEIARRMNVAAASIVIGSDRYTLDRDGKLKHDYFESTREQELTALRIAIDALTDFK